MNSFVKKYILILSVLLLAACASGPQTSDGSDKRLQQQALAAYQEGDFFVAAGKLQQSWQDDPQNIVVYEALLDAYFQLGELTKVWSLRQQSDLNSPKIAIIMSQVSHITDSCKQNLPVLTAVDDIDLDASWRARLYQVRADCYAALGQDLEALINRILLTELLPNEVQWSLYDQIVTGLAEVDDDDIIMQLGNYSDRPVVEGWLEAAYVNFGADGQSTKQWLNDWSQHPAGRYFFGFQDSLGGQKIAVLLPLSGRFAGAGKAVQQGMLTAAVDDFEQAHELLFFDTGSEGENITGAWFSAQAANVDMMIGPMDKTSIEQLATFAPPTFSVMLLNQGPQNFYRFTLSPEDEAVEVADRMWHDGLRRVLIFAPDIPWGQRMSQAFANHFVNLGGVVVTNHYFNLTGHDFSAPLRQTLGLVESGLRAKNLQSYLKLNLASEPVVRSDVDGIFLAAQPDFARLMVPQLLFNHAAHLPVYASSHIYIGDSDSQYNKDLSGVMFGLSPIQLPSNGLREVLNFDLKMVHDNQTLFALGYDALLLVNRLQWMSRVAGGRLQGLSGLLKMGADNHIQRGLQWAIYNNGGIVAID